MLQLLFLRGPIFPELCCLVNGSKRLKYSNEMGCKERCVGRQRPWNQQSGTYRKIIF